MILKRIFNLLSPQEPKEESKAQPRSSLAEVSFFPLPNTLLYPGILLPLHIFEERYKLMTEDLLKNNTSLALSWNPNESQGDLKPFIICGAGQVKLIQGFPDGRKNILVEGKKRLRIVQYTQMTPYVKALAETLHDIPFFSKTEETRARQELSYLIKRWIFLSPQLDDSYIQYVDLFTRPHSLSDFVAYYFLPTLNDKQQYLETLDRKKRVEKMVFFISKKVGELEQGNFVNSVEVESQSRILH